MHYVIIGNGILGLTTTFRLLAELSANDHITIVGKKERPGSATMVAPAMLNSFAEVEGDSFKTDLDRYKFELSRQASRAWPEFKNQILESARLFNLYTDNQICNFKDSTWFDSGTYLINNTAADDLDDENFAAIVAALSTYGESFERVSAKEIPNYAPEQRSRAAQALYIKNEGWFNPRVLVRIIDEVLSAHSQVTVVDDFVSHFTQRGSLIDFATTEKGAVLSGDSYFLAAGAATTDLIAKSKLTISTPRIFYGIGVTLEISSSTAHEKCVRTPNRGLACGLYTVPYYVENDKLNNHIAVGASNFTSPVLCAHGRLTSVASLMTGVMSQINVGFYKAELVKVNVGARPISQDGYPLIGKTSIKNLVIASGTRREGIHLAPIISEKIVSLLKGDSVDPQFKMFSPERAIIHTLSRQEAIDKAVRHKISADYQHEFHPAQSNMLAQIQKKYRDDLEILHDKVGAFDWGIPVDMLDMYQYGHAKIASESFL